MRLNFWECVVRFGRIVGKLLQKMVKLYLYCARTRFLKAMGSVLEELPIKTATHLRECDARRDLATSARQSNMYKPCSCNHSLSTSPRKRPRAGRSICERHMVGAILARGSQLQCTTSCEEVGLLIPEAISL